MGSCLGTEDPPISLDVSCTCCVKIKDEADVADGEIDNTDGDIQLKTFLTPSSTY